MKAKLSDSRLFLFAPLRCSCARASFCDSLRKTESDFIYQNSLTIRV